MKAVLLSTRPKGCEKICHEIGTDKNGKSIYEKPIEVRKTAPKCEVPFKVYIYCTKEPSNGIVLLKGYKNGFVFGDYRNAGYCYDIANGKVIGEFICDELEKFSVGSLRCDDIEKLACLSYREMINYFYKPEELDGKTSKMGYAWHISQLKIYDKPKELKDFLLPCGGKICWGCNLLNVKEADCINRGKRYATRPPQSWQYVEELKK